MTPFLLLIVILFLNHKSYTRYLCNSCITGNKNYYKIQTLFITSTGTRISCSFLGSKKCPASTGIQTRVRCSTYHLSHHLMLIKAYYSKTINIFSTQELPFVLIMPPFEDSSTKVNQAILGTFERSVRRPDSGQKNLGNKFSKNNHSLSERRKIKTQEPR